MKTPITKTLTDAWGGDMQRTNGKQWPSGSRPQNQPPGGMPCPGREPKSWRRKTWGRMTIIAVMALAVMTGGQPQLWRGSSWARMTTVRGAGGTDPAPEQTFCRTVTRQIAISPTQTAPLEITFDFRHSRLRLVTSVPAERYTIDFLQSDNEPQCVSRLTGSGYPPTGWIDLSPCRHLISSKGVIVSYRTEQDEVTAHLAPPQVIRLDNLTVRVPPGKHRKTDVLRPGKYFRVDYEFLYPVPTLVRANDSYPAKAPELRLQCYNPVSKQEIFVPVPAGVMSGHFFLPLDGTEQNHNEWQEPAGQGRQPDRVQRRQESLREQIRNWEVGWDIQTLAPAVIRDDSIPDDVWDAVMLPPPHGSAGTHPAVPGRGIVVKVATAQGECLFDTSSVTQLTLARNIIIDGWFPEDAPSAGEPSGNGPSLSIENTSGDPILVIHDADEWDMLMVRNKGYVVSSRPVATLEFTPGARTCRIPLRTLWFGGVSEGENVEISVVREPGIGHTIPVPFASLPPQATVKPPWYEVLSNISGTEGKSDDKTGGEAIRVHIPWPRGWTRNDQAEAIVSERTSAELSRIHEPVWVRAQIRLRGLTGSHTEWQGVSMIPWLPPDVEPDNEQPPPDRWKIVTDRREYVDLEPVRMRVWIPPSGHRTESILPDGRVRFYLTIGHVMQYNRRMFGQNYSEIANLAHHPGDGSQATLAVEELPIGHYMLLGRPGQWNDYVLPPSLMSRPCYFRSSFYSVYESKMQMTFGRQIIMIYLHDIDQWMDLVAKWREHASNCLARTKVVCTDTDMVIRGTPHWWTHEAAAQRNFGAAVENFPYPSVRHPIFYHPYGEGFLNPVAMHVPPPFRMVMERPHSPTGVGRDLVTHFDVTTGPCRGMFYPSQGVTAKNLSNYLALTSDELEYPVAEPGKSGISLRNPSWDQSGINNLPGHENIVLPGAPVFPIMDPTATAECVEFKSPPVVDRLSVPAFSKSEVSVTVEAGKFSYGVIEAGGKPTFIFRSGTYRVEIPEGTNRVSVLVSLYNIGCTVQTTTVWIERERPPAQQWAIGDPEKLTEPVQNKNDNIWTGGDYGIGKEQLKKIGLSRQQNRPAAADVAEGTQNRRGSLILTDSPETARRERNW